MLELGSGTDILRALGSFYVALIVVLIGALLWYPRRWWIKITGASLVLLVFTGPAYLRGQEREKVVEERQARYRVAKALFDERCKAGGAKIYKVIDGVEGILLLRVRQFDAAQSDPRMAGAAAAHESYGDFYIRSFLLFEREPRQGSPRNLIEDKSVSTRPGYQYVDVIEASDQKRYRYTLGEDLVLKREEATAPAPRFGVTFVDLVDESDRSHWVAGSIVSVLDLETQTTIGELFRYVFEPGLGSRMGQRTPWLFAVGCGMTTSYGRSSPRLFVDRVLKPAKGE